MSGKFWKVLEREKDKMFLEDYQEEMMPFANPKLRKTLRICKDPENEPPCKHLQVQCSLVTRGREVRKTARIRNQYIQVPHLSQDTKLESNKITNKHHKQEPRGQPFSSGDNKAAVNRCKSMTNTRHK